MNYEKIYNSLIQKRLINKIDRSQCYCEYHHIKPRSIYPELINEQTNIVALTAKEHYVAHHLLMHWYKELYGEKHVNYYKMLLAFQYTANIQTNNENFITARQYNFIKNERSKIGVPDYVKQRMKENHYDSSGENNSAYGRRMLFNIKTQQRYFCQQNEVQQYLNAGWVSIYDLKLFNNGKIEIFDISKPVGFKPGHLKIQSEEEKQLEHDNRSNAQKGKRFMYDPITLKTIVASKDEIGIFLANGYKFGRKLIRKTTKGYIWIYNTNTNNKKRVKTCEIDKYLNNGYILLPKETWWNNGLIEVKAVKCPIGYTKGRLQLTNVGRTLNKKLELNAIKISGDSRKRIEIINPITNDEKYVYERFLQNYLDVGYVLKRQRRYKKRK